MLSHRGTADWQISTLPDDRLVEVWPLIRLRYPAWSLEKWLVEARTLLSEQDPAAVVVAQTRAGYIYAACGYRVDRAEGCRREMTLPFVANVQWNGLADPLAQILAAIDAIAIQHGCGRIRAEGGPIAAAGETARWERAGYRWAGDQLRKALPRTAMPGVGASSGACAGCSGATLPS
jgi:hypothetical protein